MSKVSTEVRPKRSKKHSALKSKSEKLGWLTKQIIRGHLASPNLLTPRPTMLTLRRLTMLVHGNGADDQGPREALLTPPPPPSPARVR